MKRAVWGRSLLAAATGSLLLLSTACGASAASVKEVSITLSDSYYELFTEDEWNASGHQEVIPEFVTDSSIGYRNADGTRTLYYYASPIHYFDAAGGVHTIDTRLANVADESLHQQGYWYTAADSDILPYFPGELSAASGIRLAKGSQFYIFAPAGDAVSAPRYGEETTFLGEKRPALTYRSVLGDGLDLVVYPSSLGANGEVTLGRDLGDDENVAFWITLPDPDMTLQMENGGYLTVRVPSEEGKTEILGVIQRPLIKTRDGDISFRNSLEIDSEEDGRYLVSLNLDREATRKGSTVFLSFEMRREKQPDNCLYSGYPYLEYAYLTNFSVLGNSVECGIGRLMIRFLITRPFGLTAEDILSATYSVRSLNDVDQPFELRTVLGDWCSMAGNWSKDYPVGDRTAVCTPKDNEFVFDITDEVKMWCGDPQCILEQYGVQLRACDETEGQYAVMLSNDNSLYRNRTVITLK